MTLDYIIENLPAAKVTGNRGITFEKVTFDSREVEKGDMFIAVRGTDVDGHNYILQAITRGAGIIVCEQMPDSIQIGITYMQVPDTRKTLGIIASIFYNDPSKEINLIGVTGTNGKTTIATLLFQLHTGLGYKSGLLSTIEVRINDEIFTATHTTPDPLQINYYLREMVDSGCEYCFMEVSSHALSQYRIAGLTFRGGIFTNLSHEHLDYHKNFKEYLESKKSFFDQLPSSSFALVNRDDKNGAVMIQNTDAKKQSYSLRSVADYRARIVEMALDGTHLSINGQDVWIRLPGRFNVSNILAVYGTSLLCGHMPDEVLMGISKMKHIRGRFETIRGRDDITAVIDYAHTPDALLNVLQTIAEVNRQGKDIITVVGAGGNRDRAKRPKMAKIAAEFSHRVIFTSDNPRDEDPELIISEMIAGLPIDKKSVSLRIVNREEAIKTACLLAKPGDIILVAGKGHETYQEVKGKRFPFDDLEVVRNNLN